jgi:hypothetical protein
LSVHTTETASVRHIKALLVLFACVVGYSAGAIEQMNFGNPWPAAVHVDVAGYRTLNKSAPPPVVIAERTAQPKRVERLL